MSAPTTPIPARSAENWLLDAATYARDGDIDEAIAAARLGLEALLEIKAQRDPQESQP
jgi:hypothetical protein